MQKHQSKVDRIVRRAICSIIIILFAIVWPLDLILHYNLSNHGKVTEAKVIEVSTRTAKSKQTIYFSRVEYQAGAMRIQRVLSGPQYRTGDSVPVRYSTWLPHYAVLGIEPPEPPAKQTVVMRIIFGTFFSGIAILILVAGGVNEPRTAQ